FVVNAWCCFAMFLQLSLLYHHFGGDRVAYERPPGTPPLIAYVPLFGFCFIVWQGIGLARMKWRNRWLAVIFFGYWTFSLIWNSTWFFKRPTVRIVPALTLFSVLITLNVLSAFYLSTPSFRKLAVAFVAEREKRLMLKRRSRKWLR